MSFVMSRLVVWHVQYVCHCVCCLPLCDSRMVIWCRREWRHACWLRTRVDGRDGDEERERNVAVEVRAKAAATRSILL